MSGRTDYGSAIEERAIDGLHIPTEETLRGLAEIPDFQ
jgi:hypothetical protein